MYLPYYMLGKEGTYQFYVGVFWCWWLKKQSSYKFFFSIGN